MSYQSQGDYIEHRNVKIDLNEQIWLIVRGVCTTFEMNLVLQVALFSADSGNKIAEFTDFAHVRTNSMYGMEFVCQKTAFASSQFFS